MPAWILPYNIDERLVLEVLRCKSFQEQHRTLMPRMKVLQLGLITLFNWLVRVRRHDPMVAQGHCLVLHFSWLHPAA
jgi:hypothetical protein